MKTVFKNIAIVMWYVMCLFFLQLGSRLASVEEYYVDGAIMSTITISLVAASFIYKFAIKSKVNKQKEASSNISTQYDKEKASNGNIECGENSNKNESQKPDVFTLRKRNTLRLIVSVSVLLVFTPLMSHLSSVIEEYEDPTSAPFLIEFFYTCFSFIYLISFIVVILSLIKESRYSKTIKRLIHMPNRTIERVDRLGSKFVKRSRRSKHVELLKSYRVTYDDGSSKIIKCFGDSKEDIELFFWWFNKNWAKELYENDNKSNN